LGWRSWKEETAAEEEELTRAQQEIERLRQEKESILRRQAIVQRAKAHGQSINREWARLIEMQYTLSILCQQEQRHEAPLNQVPHQPLPLPPPSPPHNQFPHQPPPPPPPQIGTIYPKSPLAEHLQLAPWPLHYRAVPPPKYRGNTDPRKFLMCYKATIASLGGNEATLAKSLIISLEDATANWYSRLPPWCIYSWQQLKDKILLNFQGFQAELDTEEDFLSCAQREKETLPKFYRRFLELKAQAPEVLDEQVIMQAIKSLRAGPLHSHLVREQPKTVSELYDQFTKFNKYEVQYFRKLEQQRKVPKSDEAPRNRYGDNQCNYLRPVHNISPNGDIPLGNWGKNSGGPPQQRDPRTFDQISPQYNQRGRASNRGLLRNSFIHAHHFSVRPFILNVCCRNGQFTLSYTFSKSNFRITPFIFFPMEF
jgi:hypothetical protein